MGCVRFNVLCCPATHTHRLTHKKIHLVVVTGSNRQINKFELGIKMKNIYACKKLGKLDGNSCSSGSSRVHVYVQPT